ncbi:MAG: elongation factor 1-beta [Candidatus Nanohalarchaeota archaeon]|nr:MAG: elongation factor 1-beta [Candidatus Nanohaloarchaeota archaeon]
MSRKVLVSFKIMPTSVECDFSKLQEAIKEKHKGKVENFKIEDVAFGLKMLRALYLIEDKSGITDELQEDLEKIEQIESVECDSVTLI